MCDETVIKFGKWALSILIVLYIGFYGIYFGFYQLINNVDVSIYNRYATENQFDWPVYFNEDVEEKTGIVSEINQIDEIIELPQSSSKQAIYKCMYENIDKVVNIMNENENYVYYLEKNNTSIENATKYIQKMAFMDDKILQMDIYLVFLLMCVITVGVFKYRKTFYVIAGITYLLVMASIFSGGLSDYLVTNAINILAKMQSSIFTYQNMEEAKVYYIDAFKESMMTFIIFDTVMQILGDKKDEKKQYQIRYAYNSINIQIDYFEEQEKNEYKFIGKMNFMANYILKDCNRKIKKFKKLKRKQKKHNKIFDQYVYQLSCWENLKDSILTCILLMKYSFIAFIGETLASCTYSSTWKFSILFAYFLFSFCKFSIRIA